MFVLFFKISFMAHDMSSYMIRTNTTEIYDWAVWNSKRRKSTICHFAIFDYMNWFRVSVWFLTGRERLCDVFGTLSNFHSFRRFMRKCKGTPLKIHKSQYRKFTFLKSSEGLGVSQWSQLTPLVALNQFIWSNIVKWQIVDFRILEFQTAQSEEFEFVLIM